MSDLYESIPPERRATYLQEAQEAVETASAPVVDPAIKALGELVVKEAESLTEADAQGGQVASGAHEFLSSQVHIGDEATSSRRFPEDALDRTDLSGIGFGKASKVIGQTGLKNQLWTTIAEQNKRGSSGKLPGGPEPSS